MMGAVNNTPDSTHADAAMTALARATHAVARGADASGLAAGLEAAIVETEAFARLLTDDSLAGDEGSSAWRAGSAERLHHLHQSLVDMLGLVRAQPIQADALLHALEVTIAAEARVREVHECAEALQQASREAVTQAQTVPCVRCGHRTPAGRSNCDHCRFPLPSLGIERIETDIVGGEPPPPSSVFLERLDALLETIDSDEGQLALVEFLQNLERIYLLGGRQLDTMLAQAPRNHDVVMLTAELRTRMEGVRQMVEAVRLSVAEGDTALLDNFRHWLAEQFEILVNLNAQVEAACA